MLGIIKLEYTVIKAIVYSILVSILAGTIVPAKASDDQRSLVQSAVRKTMDNFFLELFNRQKEFKNSFELIDFAFGSKSLTKKQIATLKKTPAPKIFLVKHGLTFELEDQALEVVLNEAADGVISRDIDKKKAALNIFWSEAHAIAPAIVAGWLFFKTVVVPAVGWMAARATAGAAIGCGLNIALKSGEQKIGDACKEGAIDGAITGALIFSVPAGVARVWTVLKGGSLIARVARGAGITAAVALVAYDAQAVATMNGAVLRCNGGTDFSVIAKRDGLAGRTLYDVRGNKFVFHLQTETDFDKEFEVDQNPEKLIAFCKQKQVFPGATDTAIREAVTAMLTEVKNMSDICKGKPAGHTKPLYSSEGDNIQRPPSRTNQ